MSAQIGLFMMCTIFLVGCTELKDTIPPPTGAGVNVHPDQFANPASALFHGDAIRVEGWDMTGCRTCHGGDYAGGLVDESCRSCHDGSAGPENCATCHGSINPAPPRDVSKNETSDFRGVGAHQVHLTGSGDHSSTLIACGQCHLVPSMVYQPGHVDTDLPAEVSLTGGLAQADPTVPAGSPVYDYQDGTCASTFCHGNWTLEKASSPFTFAYIDSVMAGANYAPLWTGGQNEVSCGTCHGLPPQGHVPATLQDCGGCHDSIVALDGTIADKTLHLNGMVNVFGSERRF